MVLKELEKNIQKKLITVSMMMAFYMISMDLIKMD